MDLLSCEELAKLLEKQGITATACQTFIGNDIV